MTKHRSHSAAFKRQVAEEFLAGETLHALISGSSVRPEVQPSAQAPSNRWDEKPSTPHTTADLRL